MTDTPLAEPILFLVTEEEAGERVDKLVVRHAEALGRRKVSELFQRKVVRIDGRIANKGDRARKGEEVAVQEPEDHIRPETGALDVRLETENVVVVRKPAGQATVPIRMGETGTLAAALLGRYPEMAGVGYRAREPGVLHRLDTQTSGLVMAARSAPTFEHLKSALRGGLIEKHYLAIVSASGLPPSGIVDSPLGPDPADPRRVRVVPETASRRKAARTEWRVVRVREPWALVLVSVRHAYRHQVRVHLASLGFPIAGDALYGGASTPALGARHALHASYVAWTGDDVVAAFTVADPLPEDLAALVGPD